MGLRSSQLGCVAFAFHFPFVLSVLNKIDKLKK